METADLSMLPPEYQKAAANFKTMISGQPLPAEGGTQRLAGDLSVTVSKGYEIQNWKQDAGNDRLQISLKSPDLVSSANADALGKAALEALNKIDAVRNNVILVSPEAYNAQVKTELGALLDEAKKARLPGKGIDLTDVDLTKWKGFENEYSRQQFSGHAIQLVEGATMTQIRINIPTNTENRQEAKDTADRVVADVRRRLPEMKQTMIDRIIEKNYIPNLTEEGKKQLQEHTFDITTQQQANWTSVFINIQSKQQKDAQANPGAPLDPNLANTNMLSQVEEKNRLKLAARGALFEGQKLNKPAPIFTEVAGAEDMGNAVGKALHYLNLARPDLSERIEALKKENLFKPEQWNKAPGSKEEYKNVVYAGIHPDHPDTMNITLTLPKGKAEEVVKAIASLNHVATTSDLQTPLPGSVMTLDTATLSAKADQALNAKVDDASLGMAADAIISAGQQANLTAAMSGSSATTQIGKIAAVPSLSLQNPLREAATAMAAAGAATSIG